MSRRVWLAAAAAILPLTAVSAAEAPPAGIFTPPPGPLLLTRTLRHLLHDGKEVATRRSYRVRFTRDGDGFRLDGELADIAVNAPPGLDALAEIERRRPDTGMFPMRLDVRGMILPSPAPPPSLAQHEAMDAAATEIARMALASPEKAQAEGFVAQFQTRSKRTPWPQDLFHPTPGPRHEERLVPLPNGVRGRVTTDIDASTGPAGLLATFKRKVTTDLDGNTRVVFEEWTLAPAP